MEETNVDMTMNDLLTSIAVNISPDKEVSESSNLTEETNALVPEVSITLDETPAKVTKDKVTNVCAICLGELNFCFLLVTKLPCKHKFHRSCIYTWLSHNNTCPICRMTLSPPSTSDLPFLVGLSNDQIQLKLN
uniref:RING-type domain-containing protein n=1 Tax=Strigamia maritima TaxID=126957 RepID=T1ISL9_STRMM